jgi:hypothetical protein
MKRNLFENPIFEVLEVRSMAEAICRIQKDSGEIPWSTGGKTDPWDHVESAMALSVAGYYEEAKKALVWSGRRQNEDGSWYASYMDEKPLLPHKDANMSAYIAVGVFHHYLILPDTAFLERMWPMVSSAIDFAISLQAPGGEIYWSIADDGSIDKRALLTGSSSIYLSIKAGLAIAHRLQKSRPQWEFALRRLGLAIRSRPDRFDLTKSRYSMDWYYPVLSGAVTGQEAQKRIDGSWNKFVVEDWGVRCVSDRPWVTMAESSELILALAGMGRLSEAEKIFGWIKNSRYDDGLYWTGLTCPDSVIWPEERTSWTAAAVLLAADALYAWTPGSRIFCHDFWEQHRIHAKALGGKREKFQAALP